MKIKNKRTGWRLSARPTVSHSSKRTESLPPPPSFPPPPCAPSPLARHLQSLLGHAACPEAHTGSTSSAAASPAPAPCESAAAAAGRTVWQYPCSPGHCSDNSLYPTESSPGTTDPAQTLGMRESWASSSLPYRPTIYLYYIERKKESD